MAGFRTFGLHPTRAYNELMRLRKIKRLVKKKDKPKKLKDGKRAV